MREWCRVGDVARTNPETLPANTDSDYTFRYLDLGAVEKGHVDWNSVRWVRFADAPSRARRKVIQGDVLFGTVRPNLQSHAYVDQEANDLVASTGFCVVRACEREASGRYLFHALMSHRAYRQSVNAAVGSNYPAVTDADVRGFELFSPSVEQQRLIARILDTLDTQIRQTEALIAKLEQIKQGLLTDLLTRGIDEDGQLRPSPEEASHLYKHSPVGSIPMEWEPAVLGDLVDRKRPIVYGILMPGAGYASGIPVIKVKDIVHGIIKLNGLLLTSPEIDREYARSRLREGDLLFTIRGTVGRTAVVPPELEGANITQDTARISLPPNLRTFVRAYLGMRHPRAFIEAHTLGVAVRGINLRDVRRIPVATPPSHEAAEISAQIDAMDRRIRREHEARMAAQLLKEGLMDDLLTGQVRVTPLLDESAQATG